VQSQIQYVARGIYSMPPSYGGALVDIILADENLNALWQSEVTEMRERMIQLRMLLVDSLAAQGASKDFSFINHQKGMFSFLCIAPEQVQKLRSENSIYFVDSSRVNIAGINTKNVEVLAAAISGVL
jgi:aspartate aminotransferase